VTKIIIYCRCTTCIKYCLVFQDFSNLSEQVTVAVALAAGPGLAVTPAVMGHICRAFSHTVQEIAGVLLRLMH
jgi:hypothetical protein